MDSQNRRFYLSYFSPENCPTKTIFSPLTMAQKEKTRTLYTSTCINSKRNIFEFMQVLVFKVLVFSFYAIVFIDSDLHNSPLKCLSQHLQEKKIFSFFEYVFSFLIKSSSFLIVELHTSRGGSRWKYLEHQSTANPVACSLRIYNDLVSRKPKSLFPQNEMVLQRNRKIPMNY